MIDQVKSNPDDVTAISHEIKSWLNFTKLARALMQGTPAMKLAGEEFLPRHPLESQISFNNRLTQTVLLPGYNKTVSFLAGQVFQTDLTFADDVPDEVIEWAERIDVKRNGINIFSKRFMMNGMGKGVSHIFIDVPKKPEGTYSKKDEKDLGLRPYFKEINPEDILGTVEDENGKLILIRIAESVTEKIGRFGSKIVKRIRVIEPGKWELFEEQDDSSAKSIDNGTFSTNEIPIVTYIPGEEITQITGKPPMLDLAEINGSHWSSSSHQRNILSVARVPILFGKLIKLEKMPVGVATMVTSDSKDASMNYIEHTGAAIEAGRNDLKDLEAQMALYGLQQLIPRVGNMTATEKSITSQEASSSLSTWALNLQSVLQQAFEIACLLMDIDFPKKGVIVNTDFLFGVADYETLTLILKSHEQGVLSAEGCFEEIRRRGVFDEHRDWEEESEMIEIDKQKNADLMKLAGNVFGEEDSNNDDGNE